VAGTFRADHDSVLGGPTRKHSRILEHLLGICFKKKERGPIAGEESSGKVMHFSFPELAASRSSQCTHKRKQIRLLGLRQLQLKNQVKEFDRVVKGQQSSIV
jgi:hypothetical protein